MCFIGSINELINQTDYAKRVKVIMTGRQAAKLLLSHVDTSGT